MKKYLCFLHMMQLQVSKVLFFCFFMIIFIPNFSYSKEIQKDSVLKASQNWFISKVGEDTVISSFYQIKHQSEIVYYKINFKTNGWCIISADNRIVPILAYSEVGKISEVVDNPVTDSWLDTYRKQITEVYSKKNDSQEYKNEWALLISGKLEKNDEKSVSP